MAEYLIRNSLNPGKVVKCTVTFKQTTPKGDEGESVWVVEIGTKEPHKNGGSIPIEYIHYTSALNLDDAIKEASRKISEQVDWAPLTEDIRAPFVEAISPTNGEVVSIYSDLVVDLKEILPAAGIDPDSIKITVNGFDVTSELRIDGDPFQYKVFWTPFMRVLDNY